jgi:transposase InsO family protein
MKQFVTGERWERIGVDFVGPLGKTERNNSYLMVVTDYFSKWAEAIPLPNIETQVVADALISNIFQRFGIPLSIHTDQGPQFESNLFKELCQLFDIKKTRNTPFRPQGAGFVERTNKSVLNMLTAFVSENGDDWDKYVPFCMMAHHTAVHQSTGVTPFSMMFGTQMRLPIDLLIGAPLVDNPEKENRYASDYVRKLEEKLYQIHSFARKKLKISSDAMKRNYDLNANQTSYVVGDSVWYYNPQRKVGRSGKLTRPWKGPYQIIEKVSNILYRIKGSQRERPRVVHHDKLKAYIN